MPDEIPVVLYSVEGSVARVTLNRPEKRNALNESLIAGIKSALNSADKNEDISSVLLVGAGKDFCSGADLSALRKIQAATVSENLEDAKALMELFVMIRRARMPVIAAVSGRALAGGCGLATACDLVLASANARFGYPEVKIGFVPAMVLAILRRNVSEKRAFELITGGEEISASEAQRIGLVNQVFKEETFEDDVAAYLQKFAGTSRSAVELTKKLLYQVDSLPFIEALETGVDVNVIARMTEDCQRGIANFLKK